LALGEVADILIPENDLPLVRFKQLKDKPTDRGLTTPAFAYKAQSLSYINVKIHTINGLDRSNGFLEKPPAHREVFFEAVHA
jgi:hypothetical protein